MIVDILPDAHVPAWISFVVVYGVGLLGYPVLLVRLLLQALNNRRRAKLADAAVDPRRTLAEGESAVEGVVEGRPDDAPPVRVEIEQEGTEKLDSGQWSHLWSETNRRMHVRPFFLRLESGERVLIEPTREAILVDDLDGIAHRGARRVRTAELTPGERVIVTGVLERRVIPGHGATSGYRDPAPGWVLKSPRREPMLLSTEPLGRRFRQRARGAFAGVIAAVLLFTGVQGALLGYHLRLWDGETVHGRVIEQRHYATTNDDGVSHHYVVAAEAGGHVVRDEVYESGFGAAHEGAAIAVRLVPRASWASALGSGATTSYWRLILAAAGLLGVLLVNGIFTPTRWHESKVNESGRGRLPAGAGSELPTSDLDEMAEPVSSDDP